MVKAFSSSENYSTPHTHSPPESVAPTCPENSPIIPGPVWRVRDRSLSRLEKITAVVFFAMVALWALSPVLKLERTAVAIAGLVILALTGAYPKNGFKKEGEALEIWLWFGLLYALSTQLNTLGQLAERFREIPQPRLDIDDVFLGQLLLVCHPVPSWAHLIKFATAALRDA